MLLENRNAVIYGRGGAIGGAVTRAFAREGAKVFLTGRAFEDWLAGLARTGTLPKRFPTLAQVADFAAFVASDRAGAMTGAIANLTCGAIVD